jgi:hypothetical protein
LCPQSTTAAQQGFGAGSQGLVHPITGTGFFRAHESDALNHEFNPDPIIQIDAAGNHITAVHRRGAIRFCQLLAEILVGLYCKEGDLAFVVLSVIEVSVAHNSSARFTD